MDKIWVLAEQHDGVPLGIVLELLTAARGFGGTVEAVTWGAGAAGAAPALGGYGATKVYDLGDIGESLPGPKVAAAIAAQVAAGTVPTPSSSERPTTAVTSPVACRCVSTARC